VEVKIIKALKEITSQVIPHDTKKIVIMDLDFKMSVEQFRKFQEWIKNNGFVETEPVKDYIISTLFKELGYGVEGYDESGSKHRMIRYKHMKDEKKIFITYTIGNEVTIEEVIYFEKV